MKAIISDIHGNIQALNAVFEDIDKHSVDEIICLGDVVGYGANPNECIDELMARDVKIILGNHDEALMVNRKYSEIYKGHIVPTSKWFNEEFKGSSRLKRRRRAYIKNAPRAIIKDSTVYTHGAPIFEGFKNHGRNAMTDSYLLNCHVFYDGQTLTLTKPDFRILFNGEVKEHGNILEGSFRTLHKYDYNLCFVGHTHQPGIYAARERFNNPKAITYELCRFKNQNELGQDEHLIRKNGITIVNASSVGQPRDRDPRSCYVLRDGDMIKYRRVEYDVQAARIAIINSGLPNHFGDRLIKGV